jgi:outer membrane lipoprotein-sorting protein
MEQALTGAKTLGLTADVVLDTPEGDLKLAGSVHLAEGDRANLSFDSTMGEKHRKGTLVSDGKRMRWAVDQSFGPTQPTFPGLNRLLAAKFARAGIGFSFFLAVGQDTEETLKGGMEALYPASDFRLGATERVAGRDARAVEHTLTWAGKGPVFRATVWVDVKTHLPLKRVLTASKDGLTIRITEVYSAITLDQKLDGKRFVLPK